MRIWLPEAANCRGSKSSALHTFCDGALGTSERPTSAITKAVSMPRLTFGEAVLDAAPSVWIAESIERARIITMLTPSAPAEDPVA